jgi:hypothetical protein
MQVSNSILRYPICLTGKQWLNIIKEGKAMKTIWIMVAILMLTGWSMAEDSEFDFLPSPGLLAFGKVAGWDDKNSEGVIIGVTNVKILYLKSGYDIIISDKNMPIPDTIIITGDIIARPMFERFPDSSWIGRTALFAGAYSQCMEPLPSGQTGRTDLLLREYSQCVYQLPIDQIGGADLLARAFSNGCVTYRPSWLGMAPFALYNESEIRSFERIVGILKLTDSGERLQKLKDVIVSPTEPLSFKNFCKTRILYPGITKSPLDPSLRTQLMEWRDNEIIDPEIRLDSDSSLMGRSPQSYEWNEDRLSFLNKMKDNPRISEQRRSYVKHLIEQAQQVYKSNIEKEKQ